MRRWQGLVEEFKAHLPVNENTPKLTLNEEIHHSFIVKICLKY